MSKRDPFDASWQDDVEKFKQLRRRDKQGWSVGSVLEIVFITLAGLVAVSWFVAMFFVPDPVPGDMWLGLGGLGILVTGVPALVIYHLRRDGLEVLQRLIREVGN